MNDLITSNITDAIDGEFIGEDVPIKAYSIF